MNIYISPDGAAMWRAIGLHQLLTADDAAQREVTMIALLMTLLFRIDVLDRRVGPFAGLL